MCVFLRWSRRRARREADFMRWKRTRWSRVQIGDIMSYLIAISSKKSCFFVLFDAANYWGLSSTLRTFFFVWFDWETNNRLIPFNAPEPFLRLFVSTSILSFTQFHKNDLLFDSTNTQFIHSFNSTLKRSSSSLQVLHIPQHQPLARGRYASLRLPTPTKHEVGVHQRAMRAMHVAEILQVPIAVLRIQVISLHSMVISVQTQMKTHHYTHDSTKRAKLTIMRRIYQVSLVCTLAVLRIHRVLPVLGRFGPLVRHRKQIIVHFETTDHHRLERRKVEIPRENEVILRLRAFHRLRRNVRDAADACEARQSEDIWDRRWDFRWEAGCTWPLRALAPRFRAISNRRNVETTRRLMTPSSAFFLQISKTSKRLKVRRISLLMYP